MSVMWELIAEHGDPLRHVSRIPRTATEVFYAWTGVAREKSLNRRERNQRRWLGQYLQRLAARGEITRGVTTDEGRTFIAFWRDPLGADDPEADQPGRATPSGEDRRRDGRGVGQ